MGPCGLMSAPGRQALRELCAGQPLLSFDFDGTLAPLVRDPRLATPPPRVRQRLARLAELSPVAVISGRDPQDLAGRLGFPARYVVGHHGAEFGPGPRARDGRDLEAFRARLVRHGEQLRDAHIRVEDKGLSLALHYRGVPSRSRALRALAALMRRMPAGVRSFGGHLVLNVVPAGAGDKADALERLAAESGCTGVLYVGDDENDEPVFRRGRPDWLTVRIGAGRSGGSRARYVLPDVTAMPALLDCLLQELDPKGRAVGNLGTTGGR